MAENETNMAKWGMNMKRGERSWVKARKTEGKARGRRELPDRVKRGLAVLTDWRPFNYGGDSGEENPGLNLQCIAKSPDEAKDIQFSLGYFFGGTAKFSEEERFAQFVSDMKLIDPKCTLDDMMNPAELKDYLDKLCKRKDKIHFFYGTWLKKAQNNKKTGKTYPAEVQAQVEGPATAQDVAEIVDGADPEIFDEEIDVEEGEVEVEDNHDELDLIEVGTAADDESDDRCAEAQDLLSQFAADYELDPDDYPTWSELAGALSELMGESEPADEEIEEESEEEPEDDEASSYTALGELADGGDDEWIAHLTEVAGGDGLDPDDYPTWAELGQALDNLAPEEEEVEEVDDEVEEEPEDDSTDFAELGAVADEGDDDAIATLTEEAATHKLDPDDYATWAELGEAINALCDGDHSDDEEESGDWAPKVDEEYTYENPKGKQVVGTVIAVQRPSRTVTMKSGRTSHGSISWDALGDVE